LPSSGPFELLLAGYQALLAGEPAPPEAEDVLNDLVMKLERGLADVNGTMMLRFSTAARSKAHSFGE